jgi:hypothetical protein
MKNYTTMKLSTLAGDEPSASLERRLEQNIEDQYFSDFQYYLFAVKLERVRVVQDSQHSSSSRFTTNHTLDKHLQPMPKPTNDGPKQVESFEVQV